MRGDEARCALPPRARGLQSWGPATPAPPEFTLESLAVQKSHGLPEALRRQQCLPEGKGWRGLTAAHASSSQGCVFLRWEEDTDEAGRARGQEVCLCLPQPCPRFFNFCARGLGSGVLAEAQSSSGGLCVRGDAFWMPSSSSGLGSPSRPPSSFLCLLPLLPLDVLALLLFFLDFFPPRVAVSPFLPDHFSARQPG